MTRPVGRMVAEVIGDAGKLADQLQRDTNRALRGVDLDLDPQLDEIARSAEVTFEQVERSGFEAAMEIARQFGDGSAEAQAAFRKLAEAADDDMDLIDDEAADAAAAVGKSWERMSEKSREHFRDMVRNVKPQLDAVADAADKAGDNVSAAFAEVARDADRIFEQVGRDADEAGDRIGREFEQGGERAEDAVDELRRSANADLDAIQRNAHLTTGAASGRFKAFAAVGIAAFATIATAAAAGLGAITVFGLKSAAQLEQTAIGFEALLGSAEEAASFLREVQEFAAETPFEFQGIADASRRILAFGAAVGIARDEVLPTIETIGSLVSVLGGGQFEIESVVRALGQMASKGKVSQEELLQLAEALPGFSANAAIAAGLGVSTAEAMEMITRGEVSAKEGIDLLLEGMAKFPGAAGAMAAQAQTLTGVFSTFKDTVSIALTDAFTPVIPAIKDALTLLTPIIGDAIGVLAPAIGEVITAALPLIGVLTEAFTPVLVPILEILAKLLPLIAGPLAKLGEVAGKLVTALDPLFQALGLFIAELIEEGLIPALEALIPQITELAPAFADILIALVPLIPPLGQLLASFIKIQTPLIELLALFLQFLTIRGLVPAVAEFTKNLTLLLNVFGPFLDEFSQLSNWPDLLGRAGDSLSKLGSIIAGWASSAAAATGEFFTSIGRRFADLPGRTGDALRAFSGVLRDAVTGAFRRARESASSGLARLVSLVGEAPGRLRNLGGRMLSAGAHLIRQFLSGLGRIGGFVANIAGAIANALRSRLNAVIRSVNAGIADIDAALPFGLPRIPLLARGGLTQQGGPAFLHPSELVLPLESRRAVDLLSQAMAEASAGLRAVGVPEVDTTGEPAFDVHVYIGDRELTDIVDVRITRRDKDLRRRVVAGAGRRVNR